MDASQRSRSCRAAAAGAPFVQQVRCDYSTTAASAAAAGALQRQERPRAGVPISKVPEFNIIHGGAPLSNNPKFECFAAGQRISKARVASEPPAGVDGCY